jgi:hypothetical protein
MENHTLARASWGWALWRASGRAVGKVTCYRCVLVVTSRSSEDNGLLTRNTKIPSLSRSDAVPSSGRLPVSNHAGLGQNEECNGAFSP